EIAEVFVVQSVNVQDVMSENAPQEDAQVPVSVGELIGQAELEIRKSVAHDFAVGICDHAVVVVVFENGKAFGVNSQEPGGNEVTDRTAFGNLVGPRLDVYADIAGVQHGQFVSACLIGERHQFVAIGAEQYRRVP